jgi:hypothetical protein
LDTRTEANLNRLAGDVHFLTAPLRFIWRSILILLFLLLAPAILAVVPFLALRYASPDEIWLLKWLFGVLGPFGSTFWFLIISMIPAHKRGERGLLVHFKAFGAMAFGFLVSAGTMFLFASNYDVCYQWNDRAWFTGAWLCLLSPFALLYVCRLVKRASVGRN